MTLLAVCACGGGGTPAPHAGPRRLMLRDLGVTVIVPTYEALTQAADAQVEALRTLEAQPDATGLVAAQNAWRRARAAWKRSEVFAFGPAAALRSAAKIDWSPIRGDRIESAIAGSATFDAAAIEDLGANVKGLLALEYLLFDPTGGDAAVLSRLRASPARRAYARALGENLRHQSALLRDAWSPAAGNFAAELAAAGQGSQSYPTVKSAVDALVNQLIFVSDDVAQRQLQAPLGANGTPRPDLIVAARSRSGLADVLDDVTGIQNAYFGSYDGSSGASLHGIIESLSPRTDTAIRLSLRRVFDAAADLAVPLEEAIVDERAAVARAQQRAADLMRHLEIDMTSVLGSTLRFNPSDGD
ncbi:imelysin family protein [bacterium]|nr:imelysin family protein [bacterium]